ncbi:FkbM family methyltransferase [Cohnella herbarum]|uniref:FkbM family methyltransferase n=1 Tax=Cohnella herbarum TaxID=2728023 RepID=A0A7Z2VJ74_9BACL|nr:FkbM family methyltransferase [Cohnella herbarum]QJD84236.1 FkbM family methyltransferase [Cohnella herbarum]
MKGHFQEKQDYFNRKLTKTEYIERMHDLYHRLLFAYSELLPETDIAAIEIVDHRVIATTRAEGIKMVCDPNDHRIVPMEILNFNAYEPEELEWIYKLLPPRPVILDIGANMGWYSLHMAKQIPDSVVYAFEPLPAAYGYLVENLAINNMSNVRSYNLGLSDRNGNFDFYYYKSGSVNSSLANLSERDEVEIISCPLTRLDIFAQNIKEPIDFIKCDVEGAELSVVIGGLETIKRHKPILFLELLRKWAKKFNYHPNEVLVVLGEIGYACLRIEETGLSEIGEITDETVQTNFIFLHREKHEHVLSLYSESNSSGSDVQ